MSKKRLLPQGAGQEDADRERLFRAFAAARTAALRLAEEGEALPAEERARLEALARQEGSLREAFILANDGLVVKMAAKMAAMWPWGMEDLVQAGWEGLIRAVDRYDPRLARFSTFAVWHIMYAMQQLIAEVGESLSASPCAVARARRAWAVSDALSRELGRPPTVAEVARALGVRKKTARRYMTLTTPPVPLDAGWEVPDGEDVEGRVVAEEVRGLVRQAVAALPLREREILALSFGLDGGDPVSLGDIGRILGMSRETVRRIQKEALATLRLAPELEGLAGAAA